MKRTIFGIILAGSMIVIVTWSIEINLIYFDCYVIVSWAIKNDLVYLRSILFGSMIMIVSWAVGK